MNSDFLKWHYVPHTLCHHAFHAALGHVFWINGAFGDQRHYVWFNGFNGDDVLLENGVGYIGIEHLPPIITRAILVDVAGFVGDDPLPESFEITTNVMEQTLEYQGMSLDDIESGDVVLVYTGWANAYFEAGDGDFYYSRAPGLMVDTVFEVFGPKKVVMIGVDNWGIDQHSAGSIMNIPIHVHWLVCHGGFLYENLRLVEWVEDARKGEVPFMGGFYYSPAQIEGGVGGLGTPMVVV